MQASPRYLKSNTRRSKVWKYFLEDPVESYKKICKFCRAVVLTNSSTTGMLRHLMYRHKIHVNKDKHESKELEEFPTESADIVETSSSDGTADGTLREEDPLRAAPNTPIKNSSNHQAISAKKIRLVTDQQQQLREICDCCLSKQQGAAAPGAYNRDYFDIYAEGVATKLRKVKNERLCIEMQRDIDNLIYDGLSMSGRYADYQNQ